MTLIKVIAIVTVILLVAILIPVLVGKWFFWMHLRQAAKIHRPCFRCAAPATTDYMGLHYCRICRDVVNAMSAAVRHDPPFGFPGAEGYLEFPEPEHKKER